MESDPSITCDQNGEPAGLTSFGIADLRRELGLSQTEFGLQIGMPNKASVSLLENGLRACPVQVAIAIERMSGGRIDAAALNEDVRLARESVA